ncbi:DUF2254 domain-containing protein [Methylobacter sp. S3L5C]|uniref:DUF2254 domain-containing protein n=1 Tax=Methylobacter sp. S3L5C TaxID=2839024 RepID=UPI001FAC9553|nr:DUF2254 domain-containing protein [Methylobacter sp. S3L5C]UOA07488.1 DUF2254 domain-containing protein [Methylobacter sp. S3L5C]
MVDRLRFFLNRIKERLWIKPLAMCLLSTASVFLAKMVDVTEIGQIVPLITLSSIETLLNIIASSMLVIATFAVGSMVSAYASASSTATPRALSLVIADDVSQNALSTFIGSFIFSIVALIALQNSYYDKAGRFVLFVLTLSMFAIVIITFVSWVDRIARLGRVNGTIDKVEMATAAALQRRRLTPTLHGVPPGTHVPGGRAVYGSLIGYVQRVDINALQKYADKTAIRITVAGLPGTFAAPGRVLAYVTADLGDFTDIDICQIEKAFLIGGERKFYEDPRFGLITLSEIGSRALSPAVNDPGTAIDIIGTLVRLFALWCAPIKDNENIRIAECDRVEVPEICLRDMFDDAFTGIARDGAAAVEVMARLQKAFESLATIEHPVMRDVAICHSRLALARAESVLKIHEDIEVVRRLAKFGNSV